jgi:DNA-binding PadR family transcriptional regulator
MSAGRRASAKYAVLGLLIERPDYGYRLMQRLHERLGNEELRRNAVYRLLDQLVDAKLIREAREVGSPERGASPPERGVPRVVYEATEQGIERFERWIRTSSSAASMREELHMKIACSQPQNLPELIELTWEREQECLGQLRELEESDDARRAASSEGWSWVVEGLMRSADVAHLQTTVGWLQRARSVMERLHNDPRQGMDRELRLG